MEQSAVTGEFLIDAFDHRKLKFDKIIIECSPYLRCMMTAGQIAEKLEVSEIHINYKASNI